jgi:DNA transposase THAP9
LFYNVSHYFFFIIFVYRYIGCKNPLLLYFPTYKVSQDHLEQFFGVIRRKGGLNDNPTASQFQGAYRRILLQSDLTAPTSGNCIAQDDTLGLPSSSTKNQNNLMPILVEQSEDHDHIDEYEIMSAELDQVQKNVTTYMSGALVRAVRSRINCETCVQSLLVDNFDDENTALTYTKNRGGLITSADTRKLCLSAEATFRIFELKNKLYDYHIKKQLIEATRKETLSLFKF